MPFPRKRMKWLFRLTSQNLKGNTRMREVFAQFVREAVPRIAMKWLFVSMISAQMASAFGAEAEQPASSEAPTTAKIDVAAGQGGEEVSQLLEPIKVKMDQAAS